MVEFTLSLPLFLAVLIGMAMMSLLFFSYVTLQLSAREGASYLVHNPSTSVTAVENQVRATSFSLDPNGLTILVEPNDTNLWRSGTKVSVTVSYVVPLPRVNLPSFRGNPIAIFAPISIRAVSSMTID